MSRTTADSSIIDQIDVTSLVENYLFDFPDHAHLEHRDGEVWPAGALSDVKLQWGNRYGSLLHKACEDGRLLWVQALVAHGADPWQAASGDGLPPAGWAARAGQEACFLSMLMHPGRCPNPPPGHAPNLFHLVMAQPDPLMISAWLAWWEIHGDPLCVPLFDRPDTEGRYPPHVVADRTDANPALLSRLLCMGFSQVTEDRCGRSPADRMIWKHPEMAAPVVPAAARAEGRFKRRQTVS